MHSATHRFSTGNTGLKLDLSVSRKRLDYFFSNSAIRCTFKRGIFWVGSYYSWYTLGGSYYMITVYQCYSMKLHLKRKHFLHWLRWWCQNGNWTPLSRINECFNSGSNYNMLIYDSYPYNIPIIRKHSWVESFPAYVRDLHFVIWHHGVVLLLV